MRGSLTALFIIALASIALAEKPGAPAPTPAGIPGKQKEEAEEPVGLGRPLFGEDGKSASKDWTFGFHGYARMPLRTNNSFSRSPYLVDDNYYLSGFAYTRVNETEWAEAFLSAEKGKTRFVLGLFASQFSDWSENTLQGQNGISTAFVEHEWDLSKNARLGVRAGMFWDRNGYVPSYDTYLYGRMHIAGLRLHTRLWDAWYAKFVFGAHAEVINANQGFTPVVFGSTGIDLGWIDLAFVAGLTWTNDSKREFSIIKDGSLRALGGEVRLGIPHVGPLYLAMSLLTADKVIFLANAFEVLHSTGGRGLTQNFFGPDSANGTGEILVGAMEFNWQLSRTLGKLFGAAAGRAVRGLDLKLFGMFALAASKQKSEDPLKNFDDRAYYKWGWELIFRPPFEGLTWLFGSLRYDRVILDTHHESMAFRLITPRIGVTPLKSMNLDIFFSYSKYFYGENVKLRPNQVPGDTSVTKPDDQVIKFQAQVSW
jgi:hypothetical protein